MAQLERALGQDSLPANPQPNVGQPFTVNFPHTGQDSSGSSAQYTLTRNDVLTGGMMRPYYCILSTGSVVLPGTRVLSRDSRDIILRKLNLGSLATGGALRTATRTIEAWVKPSFNTDAALKANASITLNNHNIYVDSFNSLDPTRSVAGLPGPTVGQFNVAPYNIMLANVATNSQFIGAGDATIYGDVLTNGGTVGGTTGIQGEIRDDYFEPMTPVYPPNWQSAVTPGIATLKKPNATNVTSSAIIRGGTEAAPARYVVDQISLSGGSDVITFDLGLGAGGLPSPDNKFVEIYVRGDFTTKGGGPTSLDSGSVIIMPGVQVKIWVLGNLDFSGNGLTNNNGTASSFSLYAVNAPTETPNQTVTLAGSSRFYGSVYAPGADLKLAGGGSDGTFVGALAAKTAYLNGNTSIRYDEALSGKGLVTRFTIVSWFEDSKKQGSFSGVLQ